MHPGMSGVSCQLPCWGGGRAHGQEVALFTRTALQNTLVIAIVFLSNLAQIFTSCSKMNVKTAYICSISQCTQGLFCLTHG